MWKTLVFILSIVSIQLQAQQIKGKLLDKANQQGVSFANVFLYKSEDPEQSIGGAMTDENGGFVIAKVANGTYLLKAQMPGYKEVKKQISVNGQDVLLGNIFLSADNSIEEVEVVAEKELVQTDIATRTYNVSKDLISKGGTALDVMQNIPSVQVDENNNISLRGSSNLTILVNGKQSGLAGSNPQAIFQRIPASSIERIEVINNPSAKYDAAATGGIINIVLKTNNDDGLGGNIGFTLGTYDRYNSNFDINYKKGKFNLYSGISANQGTRQPEITLFRRNFLANTTPIIDQKRYINRLDQNLNGNIGLAYAISSKDDINFEFGFGFGKEENSIRVPQKNKNADGTLIDENERYSDEGEDAFNQNYALNYTHRFAKPRQELKLASSLGLSDEKGEVISIQTGDIRQNTFENNANQTILLQADYIQPLREGWRVETGYKSVFRNIDNDFNLENWENGTFLNDPNYSNQFRYDEKVYAGYAILAGKFQKFGFELGLRAEQTFTESKLINTNEIFNNDYLNFFPNAALIYNLPKEQQIKLTYSQRINRPDFRQLNPFTTFTNAVTLRSGNPVLRPEITNAYEFAYIKDWNQGSITGAAFYRETNDVIQYLLTQVGGDTTKFSPSNATSAQNYGLELIGNYRVGKWLNLNGDFSIYRYILNAQNLDIQDLSDIITWNTRLNAMFNLPKSWKIQAMVSYRAPVAMAQGTRREMFMSSLGISKQFFKERATLNFRIMDVARTMVWGGTLDTPDLYNEFTFRPNARTYMIGLSYRFGGEKKGKKGDNKKGEGGFEGGGEF
ncbi:MAG: outer membrane beta-barrel family protein [Thermonemataceae bacterium]|nr:outer membrane beta-barrel family protein [Thermonemataceae bacterium]